MPRLLAVLAFSVALGACDPAAPAATGSDAVTLTYWTSQNPQERAWADTLVARWNATHDVQVVAQPLPAGQSSEEVLLAAVVAGTTPDLCSNVWPGVLSDLVRADGVLALDRMPGFDSLFAARIPPALAPRFRAADGHVYQMPWKTNPILMLYNVDLFAEVGVEPPRTYSQYLAAAARLTADTDGDGQTDRWMAARDIRPIWYQRYFDVYPLYLAASGGQTLFGTDGRLAVDRAALEGVYGLFQTLYADGLYPLSTLQGNAFAQGRVATELTGPWTAAWLDENAPDVRYDYAPVPVPDGAPADGPAVTYGDYKNIAVFATTQHPEAVWAFVQYLVSPEADRLLLEMTGQIPVRDGLLADPALADLFAARPVLRRFVEQAPHTQGVDAVPSLPETLDAIAQSFERAIYGVQTPAQAVASALDRIEVIQAWARR
ncbi:ABC transporter substrate-binding protein [Rubrivirga sp. IMCC45206]|uniref:ABC transporter substrate-binding protein n=1 Tax=Rubrivirga sp. IMCC45206 TaxID=3391614 RepID=UPI0039900DBB